MAILSGYYNSLNGDRKYNAETMSKYFSGIISKGVLQKYGNLFSVESAGGMAITIGTGKAYFSDGKYIENTQAFNLTIEPSDVVLNRIDRIVLRNDISQGVRGASVVIKRGTPATNPTPPALTKSDTIEELAIADIRVNKLVEAITQANITNTKPDNTLCGYVTGIIDQVDTTELFKQYETAYKEFQDASKKDFDDWFTNIKENLATVTLIREYTDVVTTNQQDQTQIPINIKSYNYALDILEVYINGLRLQKDVEYIDQHTYIEILKPLDINQDVEIVVYKSVDGSQAETLIDQVEELREKVASLEKYTYYCNGVDDNIQLSKLAQEFYTATGSWAGAEDNIKAEIKVIGKVGVSGTAKGTGTEVDPYILFNLGKSDTSGRKLVFNFSTTNRISVLGTSTKAYVLFGGNNYELKGVKAVLGTGIALTAFTGDNITVKDSEVYINGTGTEKATGSKATGTFENVRMSVTGGTTKAVGYIVTNTGIVKIINSEILTYNQTSASEESVAILIEANQTEAVLIAEKNNIPLRARNGYKQSQTIKCNSGNASLISNVLGKAPALYSTEKCTSVGNMIISK